LVKKLEGKRPPRKPRHREEDNMRIGFSENRAESCGLDSSGPGQRPAASSCEHSNESSGSIKGREFLD
jgi:hypothetical protein